MFYYKLLFTLTTPRSPNPFHRNFFTEKYDNPWSREDLNSNWLREPTKNRATCCKNIWVTKCDACPSLQYVWKRDGTTKNNAECCDTWCNAFCEVAGELKFDCNIQCEWERTKMRLFFAKLCAIPFEVLKYNCGVIKCDKSKTAKNKALNRKTQCNALQCLSERRVRMQRPVWQVR